MLRIIVSLMCVVFMLSLSGETLAVEKKDKDKKAVIKKAKVTKPVVVKQKPALIKSRDTSGVFASDSSGTRKYDRFIDKNKNGIDDRKEKLVSKSKATDKKVPKKTTSKKSSKK